MLEGLERPEMIEDRLARARIARDNPLRGLLKPFPAIEFVQEGRVIRAVLLLILRASSDDRLLKLLEPSAVGLCGTRMCAMKKVGTGLLDGCGDWPQERYSC